MRRISSRSFAFAAAIAAALPALAAAGTTGLFFPVAEGLIGLDSTQATSFVDPSAPITSIGGYTTYDSKTEDYASAMPDLVEFGNGFVVGFADVFEGIPLKGATAEVPVVGKFRLSVKETEEWTTSFGFLTERFDFTEQFAWKGRLVDGPGGDTYGVSVKYGAKTSTFDTKGVNSFTESGSVQIGIGSHHRGKATLEMEGLDWSQGAFDRTANYSKPAPTEWLGEASYTTQYVTFKGGATALGGIFSLKTKPATETKFGAYASTAKIAIRTYSERGLLDYSAGELAAIDLPEDVRANPVKYFNTSVSFRSPGASDSYRVKFVKATN